VEGLAGEIIEVLENAKGIPDSPIPLRTVAVPGTGTDDVANNAGAGNWWILKESPLNRWRREPEIGDADPPTEEPCG